MILLPQNDAIYVSSCIAYEERDGEHTKTTVLGKF